MTKKQKLIITVTLLSATILSVILFEKSIYSNKLESFLFSNIKNENSNCINKNSNKKCSEYQSYSWQLSDSVHHYLEKSYLDGIKPILKHAHEIDTFVKKGTLVPIKNTNTYIIDTLKHSYPFLIPNAKNLLGEIGNSFQGKLSNTNLKGTRLVVTSILRTTTSTKRLKRRNRNAIKYSAHLHGTTFDITYITFNNSIKISLAEHESLKEILAKTLFELRLQKKCWVTFERFQNCFHIVSR